MENFRLKLGAYIMDLGMIILPDGETKHMLQTCIDAMAEFRLHQFLSKKS